MKKLKKTKPCDMYSGMGHMRRKEKARTVKKNEDIAKDAVEFKNFCDYLDGAMNQWR